MMISTRRLRDGDHRESGADRKHSGARPVADVCMLIDPTSKATRESETALIGRIRNGETELFYELVRPYQRDVFITALLLLQDRADAEEVAQEAILKSFLHLNQFRFEAGFRTWLIRITVNEAHMRRKHDRKSLFDSIDEPQSDGEGDYVMRNFRDSKELPEEALGRKQIRSALDQALTALPRDAREILVLRDVQQLSIAETSQLLGITCANVKVRLSRARSRMRELLTPILGDSILRPLLKKTR